MMHMQVTIDPAATPRNHLLFPLGRAFDALDVFLGGILLKRIEVMLNGAGATLLTPGQLDIYDGRVAATGRPTVGGTVATNGTLDAWRVIAGGTILTAQHAQPYVANIVGGAVPADITGMRKAIDTLTFNLAAAWPKHEFSFEDGIVLDGAVLNLITTVLTDPFSILLDYEPMTRGAARRRLSYLPGSTTKRVVTATTGGPIL